MNPLNQKPTIEQTSSLNEEQLSALKEFNSNVPSTQEFCNDLNNFVPKTLEHKAVQYWGKIYKKIVHNHLEHFQKLLLSLMEGSEVLKNSILTKSVENLVQDLNSINEENEENKEIPLKRILKTADTVNQMLVSYQEFSGKSFPQKGMMFELNSDLKAFISCCEGIEICETSHKGLQGLEKTKFLFPFAKAFGWAFSSDKIKALLFMETLYEDFKKKEDLRKKFISYLQKIDESTDYLAIKEFIVNWQKEFALFTENLGAMSEGLKTFEQADKDL